MARFAHLAALVVATGLAPLCAQTAELPDAVAQDVVARLRSAMRDRSIPGLSAAIGLGERVVWTEGLGLADLENDVAATAETVYRLASISKPITAVAALQLVEAGKLDLDAPVQDYVPAFPAKRWKLTARHLLGHLGGVRHYETGEIESARHYRDVVEPLAIFQDDPLLSEPGSRYHYTTYGYNLLGAVVAGAAKRSFVETLREQVFEPAGMTATRADDARAIIRRRAQGYRRVRGDLQNALLVDTSNKIPGGGLCGTAADLVRFAIAVRTGVLLQPATRDRMWTSMKTSDGTATGYGQGWFVGELDGEPVVRHDGGQPRVSTTLVLFPARGVEVAILCNLEGERLHELAIELARRVTE